MPNEKILIVEDEAIIAADLANKLERLEYTVCGSAASAEDALALVAMCGPELVLMDIHLAGEMDGIDAADRIRLEYGIPVIYLTAHSDRATLDRAKVTEPFGYILKPFEQLELQTHIEMALYKSLAERKLRESEERWRVTIGSIGDAVIASDIAGLVTYMNPVAVALTGWQEAEAQGQPVLRVLDMINELTRLPAEDLVARVLRENRAVELANHTALVTRDGREVPIEDSAAPITDAAGKVTGVIIVFHDVTEKRRAEEARAQLATIVTSSSDAIIGKTSEGIVTSWNRAAEQLFGYTAEEMIGQSIIRLLPRSHHGELEANLQRVARGEVVESHDCVRINKDGQRVDVSVTISPIKDSAGNIVGAASIKRDITARKQAEEELRKINCTLQAYNHSNQALLHATDEMSFLQEVCKVIIEDCGHTMVWIGYAEDDEEKSVRPIAFSGIEAGYLEKLHLTWADNERGRGPTGTAIRTGQISFCRNILTDPAFFPWREQAIQRGYASSLVLPLQDSERTFGAMTIYFRDPDPFTVDEVTLLSKLANDCAFGITTLRLRAANAKYEEALHLYELIAAHSRDMIFFIRRDDMFIVEANNAVLNEYGYSREELYTKKIIDLRTPDTAAMTVAQMQEADTHGILFETMHRRKDGSEFPVEVSSRGADIDGQRMLVSVVRDITARKQAEAERESLLAQVQRHAAELDATLNSIADGMILYDASGAIVRISPAAAAALDYQDDQRGEHIATRVARVKVERPDGTLYLPEEQPAMRAFAGETVRQEVMVLRKPDRAYWLSTSAAPIRGADGQSLGVILTSTDITELHAMQEQMETFMHLVSHDLRIPLTIIHGYLELLEDNLRGEKNAMANLSMNTIRNSVKRMGVMIDDLLITARLEGGQLPLESTPCDLQSWLPEFLQRSATVFDPQRITLTLPESLPQVQADTDRLERILTNLISNALKYGAEDTPVKVSVKQLDDQVQLSVTDQGRGIDPDHIPHLFDKFYRADTERKAEGIGLGLYITRLMVEAHGGRIWVESEVGVGSTFNFTLRL
ncbi:MAG: PAS domain S-box protein [bacterium]